MENNYIQNNFQQDSDSLNIRAELEKYLIHWKWFVIGVFLALGVAYIYLRYTIPTYSATASILIKDNKKAGLSAELEAFKDLGIVGGGSLNNTDNEIEILKSRKVIGNVVDSLQLDIEYAVEGRVITSEVYNGDSPIKFHFQKKDSLLNLKDSLFKVRVVDNHHFDFMSISGEKIASHQFNETIESKLGVFRLEKNTIKNIFEKEIIVHLKPKYQVIDAYRKKISISPVNKNSSVLILSLQDPVREKAEDILDELVKQYNLDAINDKNQVSEKTIEFINVRLKTVGQELAVIDDQAKKFKDTKEFTGLPVEAQIALEGLKETNTSIIETQIQLSQAKWIEEKLNNEASQFEVLPVSLGFESQSVTTSIEKYNQLILQRNKSKVNAGAKNPVLIQLESQIESSRSSLLRSLNNITKSLTLQLTELKNEASKVLSKVRSIPENERGFLDIARQQEIYATLYSYLLQKKEETDISLAVTVPNAKIIDVAYSSHLPVSPKKKIIYLAALLLGLLIPFVIIYILDLLDTKVHNKQDIENELSVPFMGDIPKTEGKEKIVVGTSERSSVAEAFRLIRTNLDFMLASNRKESKSIFITSTTSGEGKSFISINLAATLALSGKKVLLMGMDLRAPKVTEYLGIPDKKGITNYITDESMILEDIIFSLPEIKGLDIISSGAVPPNPAELLMTKRIENLFTIVKSEYDIVIVDTAPVNLVTDTLLLSKYADMFMYVVRANYLDKRLLAVPQSLYNEKRLPNMAIVLNDTDPKRSYGYGYGGYGYGYVAVEKPWYKRLFKG